MWDKLRKALYDEVPESKIDDKKVETVEKVKPLITNANINQTTPSPSVQFNEGNGTFGIQPAQPPISEQDKKNYQAYFNALYNKAKIQCSDYGKFLADVDTVVEGDPTLPEANKFRMAFNFSKRAGVSKERLIAAVNDAITYVENDKVAVFDVDIEEKNGIIESNSKLIENKRLAIQKLNDEITQLQADNEKTKSRITVKTLLYTTLATQLIAKIKSDIAGITNYITQA